MGLDVSAYAKIKKIGCLFDVDGEPVDPVTRKPVEGEYFQAHVNHDFPGRADDIEDRAIYIYENSDRLAAGSYGYYNRWRDELARLAGYPKGQYEQYGNKYDSYCAACWNGATGPFSELINFSDAEGVIGAVVARKLAADFAEFQAAADRIGGEFAAKYSEWRKLFEMASNSGCVLFH